MEEYKRYIRTDEGKIEDLTRCRVSEDLVGKPFNPPHGWLIYREHIIATDDNLEELIDEYVLDEYGHYCVIGDIEARDMAERYYGTVYGAIWTDKGLIFVAKMNDKGELELL